MSLKNNVLLAYAWTVSNSKTDKMGEGRESVGRIILQIAWCIFGGSKNRSSGADNPRSCSLYQVELSYCLEMIIKNVWLAQW